MKAEDYITKWCDETFKGGKELGDWTTADVMKFANDFSNKKLQLFALRYSSFDWDKLAKALNDEFGECLISAEDADENNPYDYWLQDVTVADIVEFFKNYS